MIPIPDDLVRLALGLAAGATALGALPAAGACERRLYPSSLDPSLALSAEFYVPPTPRPLCLFFHGWHMTAAASAKAGSLGPLTNEFFLVNVDLRGRAGRGGQPDASGHELLDGLDALAYARATWPQAVRAGQGPYVVGGSGGGGNTLALAGKAPDLFAAGAAWAAMSDYALWFEGDTRGRYRDEMEAKGWIGGTPASNPDAYASRGGLSVVGNVRMPLLVIHGRKDGAVPVVHAERYEAAARAVGRTNITVHYNDAGHASEDWPRMMAFLRAAPAPVSLPARGRLRVCSFLACRPFWLVPDTPDGIGDADYVLDAEGRLASLAFAPEPGRRPPGGMRLRVFGPPAAVRVRDGAGRALAARIVAETPAYRDVAWEGAGPWTAEVADASP